MHLEFSNIPVFEPKTLNLPDPAFLSYKPNFRNLKALWQEFGHFKNILVIGHGGSVTSFMAMYHTAQTHKNIKVLSTIDPDYIQKLKNQLKPEETLVIGISRSGETVTQIEALLQFSNYPLLFITQPGSVLEKIGQKLNAKIVTHPPIGGRFTGLTEVALAPAAIVGLNVEKIYQGAEEVYAKYSENNYSLQLAQIMFELENQGYVDVFLPFYSHSLFSFRNLIVQLAHESFGKEGKGQTYFAHEAPESQHHTNQRFFGGRENVAGIFISLDNFENKLFTHVPLGIQSIPIKDGSLFDLNKIPLEFAMKAEFKGTWEDAKIHGIPIVSLTIPSLNPKEIGSFVAFWQLFAIYSALLRGVDPFGQAQVESSKIISWNKRKDFHR
jgi:glucose-6-phosphate isomerase